MGCVGSIGDRNGGGEQWAVDDVNETPQACSHDGPSVGVAPLRRLTRTEYDNTVRDLLGDRSRPASDFLPDEIAGGFFANAVAPIDQQQMEDYFASAELLAKETVETRLDALLACDPAEPGCVESFVEGFGQRAFRRPLDEPLRASLTDLYEEAAAEHGSLAAIQLVLQAALLSPYFLYHVELQPGVAGAEVVLLDDHELASRLSYYLWQSMPDDALLGAARAGDLKDPALLEGEVRRMLADEKATDAITSFHGQWLGLDGAEPLEQKYKDTDLFPGWTPELAASMRAETLTFVDDVIRSGDARVETLLTASYTFLDAPLAEVYGVDPPVGDGMVKVELDPERRAGLLTQPSFLTGHAHAADVSWVLRGKFVREQLLCETLPPPPPDVDMTNANDPDRLKNSDCSPCHTRMDPIGVGFNQYDALGAFVPENAAGEPVGGEGEIVDGGGTDVTGPFNGPRELAERLAASEQVRACVAAQWFRFATRRAEADDDLCALETVQQSFREGNVDLRELLVSIALSDAFRYSRRGVE